MSFKSIKFGAIFSAVALFTSVALAEEVTVTQSNKTFVAKGAQVETLTIKAGDSIKFQNEDPFFHNIFSLSDLKTFDLGSYPKGESKTVTFEKPGVAEVECAIHPGMHLKVTVK
jgi:plastocyanin